MTACDPDLVHDLLDGVLDSARHEEVAAHVRGCVRCGDELRRLEALRARVAALPAGIEPVRDVWPALAARIEATKLRSLPTISPARLPRRWIGLAAAAVLLVAVSSAITTLLVRDRQAPVANVPPRDVQLATMRSFVGVEAEYLRAATELAEALDRQRGQLAPETVARVEASLRTIDAAITEARDALRRDPANDDLVRMLEATYRQKLDLLRRAAELPARS